MRTSLYDLFRTPIQVKIIEELLKRSSEYFTISRMAKIINASPSAVSSRVEALKELGIVRFIPGSEKAKIFSLNKGSRITKILMEFYAKLTTSGEE